MITPHFELAQDDQCLYIGIDALLAKISDTEVFVDEDEFCFCSTPYYLRLHLPGSIVEDGDESCTYEEGKFSLKFTKKVPGEYFHGLDMITSLLTPKGKKTAQLPLIEVISEENTPPNNENASENEEFSWFVKRDVFRSAKYSKIDMHVGYGFANQRSCVFANLTDEFASVIGIKDPDKYCTKMRMEQKYEVELEKFNPDHFIADFIDEDKEICKMCDYISPWVKVWKESQEKEVPFQNMIELTHDEKYKLTILPKKEYLIDDSAILTTVYLGLVDILFAYCYDVRVNEGEQNIESGWTIAKLSSVMSSLVAFIDLKDVIVSCFRRCLCYPLYRSWKLNMLVLSDLTILFKVGRLQILKSLMAIKDIMQKYELNHILNDLYIMDYCVWIQTADVKLLESLGDELSKIVIQSIHCDLDLPGWEDIAIGELEESDQVLIVSSMSQLKIKKGKPKVGNHQGLEVICEDSSSSSSSFDSDDSYADSDSNNNSSCISSEAEEEESNSSWEEEEEEEEEEESPCSEFEEDIVGEEEKKEDVLEEEEEKDDVLKEEDVLEEKKADVLEEKDVLEEENKEDVLEEKDVLEENKEDVLEEKDVLEEEKKEDVLEEEVVVVVKESDANEPGEEKVDLAEAGE